MQQGLDALTVEVVEAARQIEGMTWQQIGDALGVSRQAAHERYARRIKHYSLQTNLASDFQGENPRPK